MSRTFPFEHLRAGQPGCPSDLALDRLVAGELTFEQKRELELHAARCADCAARVAQRRAGFAAHPELDAEAVLQRALAMGGATARPRPRRLRWFTGFFGVAAVAAAVLMLFRPNQGSELAEPFAPTRLKGGLSLRVYRQEAERAQEVQSGESFRPGDKLRFRVSLPAAGFVSIVGIEADGTLYVAWPLSSGSSWRKVSAGKDQLLEGAVALDASIGQEMLWLVQCASSTEPPACTSRGPAQAPACASSCALTPFKLVKAP